MNKKRLTAGDLAEHFEVSKRTILRDIDVLSSAGIPIYTSKGRGGGISLLDGFVLDKTAISAEEQEQIIFGLQSLAVTENIDPSGVLSKLGSLFEKSDSDWIEVDFSRFGNTKSDREKFDLLKIGVTRKLAMSFNYPGYTGDLNERIVYPLKLVFKSKSWYLQSYCLLRDDYRTFKINRMYDVRILEESFANKNFIPPSIEEVDRNITPIIHLKLEFSHGIIYRIYDEFSCGQIIKNDDGKYIVETDLPEDGWLYGFLLSFGTAVRVLEPLQLRKNLLSVIKAMEKFYSE